jgi:hypothetical protein
LTKNWSTLNYIFSKRVIYVWFGTYTAEDGQPRLKHMVFSIWYNTRTHSLLSWVEFILRKTVSRPVRLDIGLLFGAHDQILSLSFLYWQLLCFSSCRAPSLTRARVCNLQCNRWLVRSLRTITIYYRLIWDCVPSSSLLTTHRDYGGGIINRLHTGFDSLLHSMQSLLVLQPKFTLLCDGAHALTIRNVLSVGSYRPS